MYFERVKHYTTATCNYVDTPSNKREKGTPLVITDSYREAYSVAFYVNGFLDMVEKKRLEFEKVVAKQVLKDEYTIHRNSWYYIDSTVPHIRSRYDEFDLVAIARLRDDEDYEIVVSSINEYVDRVQHGDEWIKEQEAKKALEKAPILAHVTIYPYKDWFNHTKYKINTPTNNSADNDSCMLDNYSKRDAELVAKSINHYIDIQADLDFELEDVAVKLIGRQYVIAMPSGKFPIGKYNSLKTATMIVGAVNDYLRHLEITRELSREVLRYKVEIEYWKNKCDSLQEDLYCHQVDSVGSYSYE